jgi:UDP-N-acetylmuramoyl-tripeptide--D-alanyl-D-alanine ligase
MQIVFSKQELSEIFHCDVAYDVGDICVDSRSAKTGDVFIALNGEKVDGHNFAMNALDNGASLIIAERKISVAEDRLILCESSYDALRKLAEYNLKRIKDAKYICVTGSVGKTTTKDMLQCILADKVATYASRKNFNSQIGLPICAATMPRDTNIGVFEMGMSAAGDIRKLIDIVPPTVAVITNIGESHLEFFNSMFDIAKAKAEIFEKGAEYAVIPSDSPYKDFLKNKATSCGVKNIFSVGRQAKSDARVTSYNYNDLGITISAEIFGKSIQYELHCSNESCILNSLASITAAHVASGKDIQALADSLVSFSVTPGRGETFRIYKKEYNLDEKFSPLRTCMKVCNAQLAAISENFENAADISSESAPMENPSIVVINDAYNASPASVKSAIRSLARYGDMRKILVIGDMLELGPDSVRIHENLSATIDKYEIDLVFACGELSKRLYNNLRECKKGAWKIDSQELVNDVLNEAKYGDCILVKGSHSMNMELIVTAIKDRFSYVL